MYEKQRFPGPSYCKASKGQCAADWPEVKDAIPGMNVIGNQVTPEAAQEIGARKVPGCDYLV